MIAFNEVGTRIVSFLADSGLQTGEVCKLTANGTVGSCDEDDSFIGVVSSIRAGVAGVVMAGYVELPYSGASAPSLGEEILAADGEGGVAAAEAGKTCLVVTVDTTAKTVGLML